MFQIKKRSTGELSFLTIFAKWLVLLAGLTVTLFSIAFISYGLAVATLFLGIALVLNGAANFISTEKQAIKRTLNRCALIVLAGGLVFYGLLFLFSLQYP